MATWIDFSSGVLQSITGAIIVACATACTAWWNKRNSTKNMPLPIAISEKIRRARRGMFADILSMVFNIAIFCIIPPVTDRWTGLLMAFIILVVVTSAFSALWGWVKWQTMVEDASVVKKDVNSQG